MMWFLYGIVEASPGAVAMPPSLPPGVDEAPVKLVDAEGLAAAVSAHDGQAPPADTRRTLAFARVVEALHDAGTVVPMRYGCVLGAEEEVVELLRVRRGEYAAILRVLAGCVEMGVRILGSPDPELSRSPDRGAGGTPGRTYLGHRAAAYAREGLTAWALAAASEHVCQALGPLAERTRIEPEGGGRSRLASVYFLVRRGRVDSFRREFRRVEAAQSTRLLLSGPWPPYNFASFARRGGSGV